MIYFIYKAYRWAFIWILLWQIEINIPFTFLIWGLFWSYMMIIVTFELYFVGRFLLGLCDFNVCIS